MKPEKSRFEVLALPLIPVCSWINYVTYITNINYVTYVTLCVFLNVLDHKRLKFEPKDEIIEIAHKVEHS